MDHGPMGIQDAPDVALEQGKGQSFRFAFGLRLGLCLRAQPNVGQLTPAPRGHQPQLSFGMRPSRRCSIDARAQRVLIAPDL